MIRLILTLACGSILAAGCAAPQQQHVLEGKVKTPGVTIESAPGASKSFVLVSGQIFNPPFEVNTLSVADSWDLADMVNKWKDAVALGAQSVRVRAPGQTEPLYGVLVLGVVPPNATGPGARSYLIEVPQNYVDAAQDGKISVVYEKVPYNEKHDWFSWALWLSDRPFR